MAASWVKENIRVTGEGAIWYKLPSAFEGSCSRGATFCQHFARHLLATGEWTQQPVEGTMGDAEISERREPIYVWKFLALVVISCLSFHTNPIHGHGSRSTQFLLLRSWKLEFFMPSAFSGHHQIAAGSIKQLGKVQICPWLTGSRGNLVEIFTA